MERPRHLIGLMLLLLVLVSLVWIIESIEGNQRPAEVAHNEDLLESRERDPVAITEPEGMVAAERALVNPMSFLLIKYRDGLSPISGVAARRLGAQIGRSLDIVSAPILATSNDLGVLDLPVTFTGALWLGGASGVAAAVTTINGPGQREVLLERGYPLSVQCTTDSGAPITGCCLSVSLAPIHYPPITGPYFGDPRSRGALWTALSDENGLAIVSDLPSGRYNVVVSSPTSCSQKYLREVQVPCPAVSVKMVSLRAIVVGSHSGLPIIWSRFSIARDAYSRDPCFMTRKVEIEHLLQKRFPGCVAYVGFASERAWQDIPVKVWAVLADGSEGSLEWSLQPVEQIESPVYLEVDPSSSKGMGHVKVELYCNGSRVGDIPLRLGRYRSNQFYDLDASEPTLVPAATYRVQTQASSLPFLSQILEEREVVVERDKTQVVRIELPQNLARVEVVPAFPDNGDDARLSLQINWSSGGVSGGETYLSWSQREHGTLRTYLPIPASINISVGGVGYKTATWDESIDSIQPATIQVPLEYEDR